MSHDLIAELGGYRDELANYERSGRKDRMPAVKAEIDRVAAAILTEAERLVAQAEAHEEAGQDVLAAQCRVEAKRLVRGSGTGAPENAADSTPVETAVPAKAAKKKES